jgi:hypothetical protein
MLIAAHTLHVIACPANATKIRYREQMQRSVLIGATSSSPVLCRRKTDTTKAATKARSHEEVYAGGGMSRRGVYNLEIV